MQPGSTPQGTSSQKVAWVSGGTSGIGLAIAKKLVAEGASVAVLGRDRSKADKAVQELETIASKKDSQLLALNADVREYDAVEKAAHEVSEKLGALDIVVSAAAGNFLAPVHKLSSGGFQAVVDIDLVGSFHVAKAAFPRMRKPGASLLHISAPQALMPAAGQAHVCAAKAGIDMLTKTLALEWGGLGIRVNSLIPGPIEGTEGMDRLAPTPEIRTKIAKTLPLGRLGTLDEIASAAAFLCSDAASYIHGSIICCDGGQALVGFAPWTAALRDLTDKA